LKIIIVFPRAYWIIVSIRLVSFESAGGIEIGRSGVVAAGTEVVDELL